MAEIENPRTGCWPGGSRDTAVESVEEPCVVEPVELREAAVLFIEHLHRIDLDDPENIAIGVGETLPIRRKRQSMRALTSSSQGRKRLGRPNLDSIKIPEMQPPVL